MIDMDLVKSDLESIIDGGIDPSMFPYVKGKSIRIGKMVVRKSKKGYLVYDCAENKQVARLFVKATAIALAKELSKDRTMYIDKITRADQYIQKYITDALFYKNTIEKAKDEMRKDLAMIRLECAEKDLEAWQSQIDKIIFTT